MKFSEAIAEKPKKKAPPPAVIKPLDLEAAKENFAWVHTELDVMRAEAKDMVVLSDGSLSQAVGMTGKAKDLNKKLQAEIKRIIGEPEAFVKSLKGFGKMFAEKLVGNVKKTNTDCIELVLKKKIGDYQYQQELERRKQEEVARKAAAELQEKLRKEAEEANRKAQEEARRKAEEEAKAAKASKAETEAAIKKAEEEAKAREIEAPTVIAPVLPAAPKVARAESGASSHLRKTWKGEIVKPTEVPREYCEPSQKLITQAVKQGIREIPGVNIFEDIDSVIRT